MELGLSRGSCSRGGPLPLDVVARLWGLVGGHALSPAGDWHDGSKRTDWPEVLWPRGRWINCLSGNGGAVRLAQAAAKKWYAWAVEHRLGH